MEHLNIWELPDLVSTQILKYVDFVDLCRLRLTSTAIKRWVSDVFGSGTRVKIEIGPEDNGNQLTFESAVGLIQSLGFDIHTLKLNNNTPSFYDDPFVPDFLSLYGPQIKWLHLRNYFPESIVQLNFLNTLSAITNLKIDMIDVKGYAHDHTSPSYSQRHVLELPHFFENIKRLTFGTIRSDSTTTGLWYSMIRACPKLNYLRYPLVDNEPGVLCNLKFQCFKDIITRQRAAYAKSEGNWLWAIDLKHLGKGVDITRGLLSGRWEFDIQAFLEFMHRTEVVVLNMHSEYFRALNNLPLPANQVDCFSCIVSVIDCQPNMRGLPLSELDRISIKNLHSNSWVEPMDEWENLRSIRIHFDEDVVMAQIEDPDDNYDEMFDFLLLTEPREWNLTELRISFDPALLQVTIPSQIFNPRKISNQIYCLRSLSLIRWNPTNKAFTKLWNGLPSLEELHIEDCPSFGNVALIGENLHSPVFLQLVNLNKLTMGLNEMPKVTERAFKDVFRHMRLKEFHMFSSIPLSNITRNAILWLEEGHFAKTIERFPFTSWSAMDISQTEMVELKARFKSLIS